MRPLTVAADTANGMGGLVVPAVMARLPVTLHHLFAELDGTFPNHPADPIDPENQKDLKAAVLEHGADIGLAFDGDADRVFLVDEQAEDVSGSLADRARRPGDAPARARREDRAQPDLLVGRPRDDPGESGGEPIRTRVGHSFIKQVMAETGAIFGGEHSGHYYFRDNYRADSGLIAAVVALGELSAAGGAAVGAPGAVPSLLRLGRDQLARATTRRRRSRRSPRVLADGRQDRLDGLTVEYDDWWCNVRASNTEPLLRLNVEATTPELLAGEDAEAVLDLIRGEDVVVTLDPELLEILVCPNDRGELDYLEDEQRLVCRTCGYRYPVRDDIPVMLIDEAEKPGTGKR